MRASRTDVDKIEQFLTSIYQNHGEDGDPTPLNSRLALVLRQPVLALSALRYLLALPVVHVTIPKIHNTHRRWLFTPRRPWQHEGFVSSYLALPTPLENYWRGTTRQNLRTRTHQAQLAGYAVKPVDPSEIIDVISQVFKDKDWNVDGVEEDLRKRDLRKAGEPFIGAVCVGVYDVYGHVVGFCVGTQTGNVVRTLWSFTSQKGSVRWLCFRGFVEEVYARGGRFIIESPPWAFTGGNQIFAGHLGFKPGRVRG